MPPAPSATPKVIDAELMMALLAYCGFAALASGTIGSPSSLLLIVLNDKLQPAVSLMDSL